MLSAGQAHLPSRELIRVEFGFLFEKLSRWMYRASREVSQSGRRACHRS